MAALTMMTSGATAKQARPAPPVEEIAPRHAGEPIMAIVSIKTQHVTFYDADGWILRAPVSTGVKGRETPAGVFAILEKEKEHRSTMYDDAEMPNMQRITWNGVALHGGPLPGYAASHGCVRMPYGFADKLFDRTRIGTRVIVSPNDASPVEFSHPSLLVPKADAITNAPKRAEILTREAAEAVRAADEARKASAPRAAASLTASLRKLEQLKTRADGEVVSAEKARLAADQGQTRAERRRQDANAKVAELGPQLDAAKAEAASKIGAAAAAKDVSGTDDDAKKSAATASREAASAAASLRKLELLKTRADAGLSSADKAVAAADQAKAQTDERKRKADVKAADARTQLDLARADTKAKLETIAAAKNAAKTAETRKAETAKAASDAMLALEPVSIYISRATRKLYVRRNTHKPARDGGGEVFDSSIEVPITIRDPDKPIGTHIFTAMARSDTGLRWSAVTIDAGDDARSALDRITIPKDVLDRVAPTALPRSSIVVSDEPPSAETNYRTEFVAVLNNQPQGGFITRKPTPAPDARVANGDGLGSFFPFNWQDDPAGSQPRNARRRGGQPYPGVLQPAPQGWSTW